MTRIILAAVLVPPLLVTGAAADSIGVQQNNARNYVTVIQERSPFHANNRTLTATTGHTTVTEIVAIGPDPVPVGITQTGLINRAVVYQRGTAPNLDVRQDGIVNRVRSQQYSMP